MPPYIPPLGTEAETIGVTAIAVKVGLTINPSQAHGKKLRTHRAVTATACDRRS
jgi:hypothetical protein